MQLAPAWHHRRGAAPARPQFSMDAPVQFTGSSELEVTLAKEQEKVEGSTPARRQGAPVRAQEGAEAEAELVPTGQPVKARRLQSGKSYVGPPAGFTVHTPAAATPTWTKGGAPTAVQLAPAAQVHTEFIPHQHVEFA